MDYRVTAADRRPIPAAHRRGSRHLGYDADELRRPFAHFFTPSVRPIQPDAQQALVAGAQPPELGYEVGDAVDRLARPGYEAMENGWTRTRRGTLLVACRTDMPAVTAAMWDWWFGWHSTDAARYKLWNPTAHLFATLGDDRSADRSLTDRQRYVGNVSYVDEYIGDSLNRLAIRFADPTRLGFADRPGTTHICARVGPSNAPIAAGWLIHQVRPTEDGSEMRSRFFLGHPEVLDVPPHAVSNRVAGALLHNPLARRAGTPVLGPAVRIALGGDYGRNLLHHCAAEMNHLAAFLPALHAEFGGTP